MMRSHHHHPPPPPPGGGGDNNDRGDDSVIGSPPIQHRYHALVPPGSGNDDTAATATAGGAEVAAADGSHNGGHNHNGNNGHNGHNHDNDDVLWDQLNDEQSREVRQHQSRFHAPPGTSRSRPLTIAWSMATEAAGDVGTAVVGAVREAGRHVAAAATTSRGRDGGDGSTGGRGRGSYRPPHAPSSGRRRGRDGGRDPMETVMDDFDLHLTTHDGGGNGSHIGEGGDEYEEDEGRDERERLFHPPDLAAETGAATAAVRPLHGYPFVVLHNNSNNQTNHNNGPTMPSATPTERDNWGVVGNNLDVFLSHLYRYYYHRGLVPMACEFVVETVSLLLTLWLSRTLLGQVDWKKLVSCKDESSCSDHWTDYYRNPSTNPLPWAPYLLLQGYTALILIYATLSTWTFYQSLKHAATCRTVLHERLGLSERKLRGGALPWDVVVRKLVDEQASGRYRTTTTATAAGADAAVAALDALSVAQRIMRKDNFLIAFWNRGLLDGCKIGGRVYWSGSLEWAVHLCVLNFMFNHRYEIRPAFVLDAPALQRRLKVCGLVHLFLLPFGAVFVTLHFFLKNVYDLRATREYMGDRQWSTVATWTFREFNELPHVLEQRLRPSHEPATRYVGLFGTSEYVAAVGRLLVFGGGGVGGVLLALGVLNDAILLHVQLGGRNLLWYAGMAGIVYSVGKALLPTKEATPSVSKNLFEDMDAALKEVSQHTHHYPEHWKGRGWDAGVCSSFKALYDTKVRLFLYELVAMAAAPYILFYRLPEAAPAICEFCLTCKAKVPGGGGGDVCGYSTFDFDAFGDEAWEGRTLGKSAILLQRQQQQQQHQESDQGSSPRRVVLLGESLAESIVRTGNLEDAARAHPTPRARGGKMEKSFFGFQAAHPDWKCPPSGQTLVDRVEEYRAAAMARERSLHVDAAARQLETLARLERQTSSSSPRPDQRRFEAVLMRNSHHHHRPMGGGRPGGGDASSVPPIPTADAGAGSHSFHPAPEPQQLWHQQEQQPHHNFRRSVASMAPHPPPHPPALPPLQSSMPSHLQMPPATHDGSSDIGTPGPDSTSHAPNLATVTIPRHPSMGATTTTPAYDGTSPLSPHDDWNRDISVYGQNQDAANSAALELSTELSRLFLGGSGLLDEAGPHHPIATTDATSELTMPGRDPNRQYYWLERFHEHLERQQEQDNQQASEIYARSASAAAVASESGQPSGVGNEEWGPERARSLVFDRNTGPDGPHAPARGTNEDATSASSIV